MGHIGGLNGLRLPGAGVEADGAGPAGGQRSARQHHRPPPSQAQPLRDLPEARLAGGQRLIGLAQQQRCLRQVGGDDVRQLRQPGHAAAHGGGVGLVDPAVVPHHRVHHHHGVRSPEPADKVLHHADLPLTAQEAAVYSLECQAQAGPVVRHLGHFVGHVQKGEPLEPAGMGGEKCRGQGAALDPHGGENRNGHSERTPAEAGHVMNGSNAWGHHGTLPLFNGFEQTAFHCIVDFPIVQEEEM